MGTGYVFGFSSVGFKFDEEVEGEDDEIRVESAPWVMITKRGREALDLDDAARVEATCSRGVSYLTSASSSKLGDDNPRHEGRLTLIPAACA